MRHITIAKKVKNERVSKTVMQQSLKNANLDDENTINDIDKLSAAGSTPNNCQAFNSNTSFFISRHFEVHVSRSVVSDSLLEYLMQYLSLIEETERQRDLGDAVSDDCATMYHVDKDDPIVQVVTSAVPKEFKNVVGLTGKKENIGLRSNLNELFNGFVHAEKVTSLCSYLEYEESKFQECSEHRDVDATFCTAILILQDTLTGHSQVKDSNLKSSLETGCVVSMDHTATQRVTKADLEKDRKVVFFII